MRPNPDGATCNDCDAPVRNDQEHAAWEDFDLGGEWVFAHLRCADGDGECPCGCAGESDQHWNGVMDIRE